jgi:hypothetical protein
VQQSWLAWLDRVYREDAAAAWLLQQWGLAAAWTN